MKGWCGWTFSPNRRHGRVRRLLAVAACGAAGVATVGPMEAWGAATTPPATPDAPVTLADERVTESSGPGGRPAPPRDRCGRPTTPATGRGSSRSTPAAGGRPGVHRYGAPGRDVEALAVSGTGRVLVGDVGDNTGPSRDLVRVFWFDEPALGTATSGRWASWGSAPTPTGPHDAEALAADPAQRPGGAS